MKLSLSILFAALGVVSAFEDVANVTSDAFTADGGINILGGPCIDGVMTYSGSHPTLSVACMKTGIYFEKPYALVCGPQGKSSACEAYYDGMSSGLQAAKTLGIPGLVAKNFKSKVAGELCNEIADVALFKDMFTVPVANQFIELKVLKVGNAMEDMWREVSGVDICFFQDRIQSCADAKTVLTQEAFELCVMALFDKYETNGWISAIDKSLINKVVDLSNVFTPTFISKKQKDLEREELRKEEAKKKQQAKKAARKQDRKMMKKIEDKEDAKDAEKDARKAAKKQARKDKKKAEREANRTPKPTPRP